MLFHSLLLGIGDIRRIFSERRPSPAAAFIQARLLPAIEIESLLKDTLTEARSLGPEMPVKPESGTGVSVKDREQGIQRKLLEHLFYPPEAVHMGLEGEVRLLLTLDPQGAVIDARIASSSGYALLDRAATDAAYAMRRFPAAGAKELILPVVFKLR